MAYEVVAKIGYVQVRLMGQLTVSDLTEAANCLDQLDTIGESSLHRLVDISEVENLAIQFDAMHSFSVKRASVRLRNNVKTAIVARTLVQYGCARMFQMLNKQPQTVVEAFRESDSALHWILKQKNAGAAA
jgi:hypothetical protein